MPSARETSTPPSSTKVSRSPAFTCRPVSSQDPTRQDKYSARSPSTASPASGAAMSVSWASNCAGFDTDAVLAMGSSGMVFVIVFPPCGCGRLSLAFGAKVRCPDARAGC